ncbi:unnamed protein product [Rotaria socialis]|uniref:DUF676 domain-containing protein n=2 Tax=Rotaria socialis TaxID=392032 RepID=A0A818AZU1_9BILA|nr:unnamed protein product [Rotaria socialis]CAF3413617.1 unnamed protein product [Rotaria socialis]CAF4189052.1 unnamed protein product [Rotaria socialis]
MADLQAEIELTVELRKFINIDLFVQGYYQIRTGVKFSPRVQSATKIEVKSELSPVIDDSNDSIYPACVFNDWGVSKTFLIIFKNEEVQLDDQFNFKLSVIIDAQNIVECFNRLDMQLFLELYFLERDYTAEKMPTMQQLCSRCFKLHFDPRFGIHTHVPILFDYFHLSALTTTVHSSLLCLIPPYVFDRPDVRRTSLFSFLFGQDLSQITTDQINPALLERAYNLHNRICEILLSSYQSLQDFYEAMLEHLPDSEEKPIHVHQKCEQKLRSLSEKLQNIDDIHTIDNLAHAHIAQCSAENIMVWCQFIQTFGLSESSAIVLGKEYHLKRVRRLSEGFFQREMSRVNLLTNESYSYNELHELVRNSSYYSCLLPLTIECVELDGVPDTLPIIIEEIYLSDEQKPSKMLPSSVKMKTPSAYNDNPFLQAVQNFSKFRPNLGLCLSGSMDETVLSSLSKPPATPPLKSQKQSSKPATNDSNSILTPKLRQSGKNLLPFRTQTPTNINRIIAFSNDPSIQLTSYRKFDHDTTPTTTSSSSTTTANTALENDVNSSSSLFPYQSDSDITNSSHSLRLQKHASRYSLPDVPFQRRNSITTTKTDLVVVPQFLSATTNKTDDVFINEQEKVVAASTFGDSSMKSKVLQASFRGKTNTMDRRTAATTTTPFRSQSTSTTNNKRNFNIHPKYFTTKASDISTDKTTNGPVNCSLDSVLNLTLQLEQTATADYQRRHTISTHEIDPLLLNGLTDDENQLHLIEKMNGHYPATIIDENHSIKDAVSSELDRIETNSVMNNQETESVMYKEKIKQIISSKYSSSLMFYSDFSILVSTIPYFYQQLQPFDNNGVHLVVCVHGLDGNSGDLRLIKTYLELCLPTCRLDFLMSSANHSSTFDDIDIMVTQLIDEIEAHIERYGLKPQRISFVGHSLGNLVVRATVSHPRFERFRTLLYTYLSLSGPHLGTLFNSSGLVNMGMWLMQKWKKSCSLSQMSFKDHVDPKQTYLYKLSKKPCLEYFKNILLIASPQDRYVPFHSARIELCKAALKDTVYGSTYVEMINNLLEPILRNPSITFVRYNAFHNIPSGTNNFIGRAAHIAILDSELFVEKFILVSAAKYFK